ncbi:MAG: LPS export ABC transporter periplasmic protein LptC [Bacteroidaceae bacterium]|nr:LPS export ABC transporter periplasmic protein LptC [Bacteroidaceae bacterium]
MNRKHLLYLVLLLPSLGGVGGGLLSCASDDHHYAPAILQRDSLPVLKSIGVSTLISDSGIIRYKIISEDWFIYDRKQPTYWAFEKGLFVENFDENYHVEAFINCDTAYYYDQLGLWELRGRVVVKNLKDETFKTSLLYWNTTEHRIYSPAYMKIQGIDQELDGYDFSSNEQMTEYRIHSSSGAFPVDEDETPHPDDRRIDAPLDSTSAPAGGQPSIGIPPVRNGVAPPRQSPTQLQRPDVLKSPRRPQPAAFKH